DLDDLPCLRQKLHARRMDGLPPVRERQFPGNPDPDRTGNSSGADPSRTTSMAGVGRPMTDIEREDFRNLLGEIGKMRMPFGKYGPAGVPPRGMPIYDLPPEYLSWFKERGFPKGRLGE